MQNLRYVGKNLFIEKLSINNIVKKNKTPFYLYSENQIINNYLKFTKSFKKTNPLICFAAKSNSNVAILKILGKLGAGADVVSGGELLKALKAGIKASKIVFSGVGKTEDELKIAINKKILLINCESESEAKLVNKIAKKVNKDYKVGDDYIEDPYNGQDGVSISKVKYDFPEAVKDAIELIGDIDVKDKKVLI